MDIAIDISHFEGVTMAAPHPISGVSKEFKSNTSNFKLNIGIGGYRTKYLQPYVLNVVKKSNKLILEEEYNQEYYPIKGLVTFNKAAMELLLVANNNATKQG